MTECGVVGAPDDARGMIVKAYVVLAPEITGDAALVTALQDHVRREIAPYKYPRAIEFVAQLPKTETGKLKRFALRQMAQAGASSSHLAADDSNRTDGEPPVTTSNAPALAVRPAANGETSPARRFCSPAAGRPRRDTPTAWPLTDVSW